MAIDKWQFGVSVGDERQRALEASASFDTIVDEIKATMSVRCCHDNRCDDAPDFSRVIYCVTVSPALFDQFFNSRHGYRAAYFRSPYEGLAANSLLLRSLLPSLLAAAPTHRCSKNPTFIEESFTSESAKAWLAESGIKLCGLCDGEWKHNPTDPIEISNGRWELGASTYAKWGRAAPYLNKIRLFGAFLNDRCDEFVPTRKRHRAWEICESGWS
jgi:hypothetical protein